MKPSPLAMPATPASKGPIPSHLLKHPKAPDNRLHGIVPPMITPLLDHDTLDVTGLERLVEHMVAGGVHAIFILGTSGEAPNLSYRLRRELIQRTCRLVRNRVPILVGITDTSMVEALQVARCAADAGAHTLVTSTPYYFPNGQAELREYLERLVPQLPLPVMLYNMPAMTKTWFEFKTLQQLTHLKNIVGLKDSSGDLPYFKKALTLRKLRPDWSFLVGWDHLLADGVKSGGHGGVNGGAQIWPALFVELYEAAAAANWTRVKELQPLLLRLGQIYKVGKEASSVVKAMKCALSHMGVCRDVMEEPFSPFNKPERERVRKILKSLGLPVRS